MIEEAMVTIRVSQLEVSKGNGDKTFYANYADMRTESAKSMRLIGNYARNVFSSGTTKY
jgi:hypothetical protein